MKRKRSKSHEQMTLFPFLAVLVCTMGVLIILLVIVTKMADDQAASARRSAEAAAENELDQLQLDLETEKIRVEGIRGLRPGLQEKLSQAQSMRSRIEDELRDVRDRIETAKTQLVSFNESSSIQSQSLSDAKFTEQVLELQNQIEIEKRKAEQLQKQAKAAPVYSIVPFDGDGGIRRRPIYVECTERGLVLQPYQILLKNEDFVRPVLPGNPFDAALLAIREYWTKLGLVDSKTLPYPLLVVRPDGAEAYGLARQAMRNWDDQFGYELIDQQMKLDFGQKDIQLAQKLKTVIEDAKRFQRKLVGRGGPGGQQAGGLAGSRQPITGLRASPSGGFVSADGNGAGTRVTPDMTNPEQKSNPLRPQGENGFDSESTRSSSKPSRTKDDGQFNPGKSHANGGMGQGQQGSSSQAKGPGGIQPISNRRGKNWALPTRTQGATAYKRPIRLVCSQQQLVLKPSASHREIRIPFEQNPSRTVDQLVNQVWKVIDSWDIAAAGGYWKPELVIEVPEGGQQNYSAIKTLLEGSGLEIRRAAK